MLPWLREQRRAIHGVRPETLLIQMYSLKVALAFGLGAVVLAGGDERFSGPTFRGPKNLFAWTDLNPRLVWGMIFLCLGAGLVWAIGKPVAIQVLRFGLVVYCFLVVTFLWSAFQSPTAALTGVVAYGTFAAAHALLSVHLDAYGWN